MDNEKLTREYFISYRVGTIWHEPHNTTTYNNYVDTKIASTASGAIDKVLTEMQFSNPNKFVEILSVKAI